MCVTNASICNDYVSEFCIYVPFCVLFIILGLIQIVSGIFYFLTIPLIKLIVNICIGCWVILSGVGGGMVAYICLSTPKKYEFLLYCSISVLALNVVNLVLLEIGQIKELFSENVQKLLGKEYDLLELQTGRLITTITTITLVFISFIETQITFCYLNKSLRRKRRSRLTKSQYKRRLYLDNDQAADLEYVIPKKPEEKKKSPEENGAAAAHQLYANSWVFEGTGEEDHFGATSISLNSSSTSSIQKNNESHTNQRRASKISDENSERHGNAQMMSSFSRCPTPTPVLRSGQTTPILPDHSNDTTFIFQSKQNRLTVDYIPKIKNPICQQDDGQYASLLVELEQSLIEKKLQAATSNSESKDDANEQNTIESKDNLSSDTISNDFSKELEAALQSIQELDTPSEMTNENSCNITSNKQNISHSASEKTLNATFISLTSPSPEVELEDL